MSHHANQGSEASSARRHFLRSLAFGAAALSLPAVQDAAASVVQRGAETPSPAVHTGRLGSLEYAVLHDGAPGDWPRNVLLLMSSEGPVLIEAGNGDDVEPHGFLPDRLAGLGLKPGDIRAVFLSHADWDHVGGAVDERGRLMFPKARHFLPRKEFSFWRRRPERLREGAEATSDFRRIANVVPVERLAQLRSVLELLDPPCTPWPGIRYLPLPGHTPGYTVLELEDGGERLVYVGDMVFDPSQLVDPTWVSPYDREVSQTQEARARLLGEAAGRGDLLLAYHVAFPGLGRVERQGEGFRWKAMTPS